MTGEEIAELFEQLGRLVAATKKLAGDGTTWDHTFSNGHTQCDGPVVVKNQVPFLLSE